MNDTIRGVALIVDFLLGSISGVLLYFLVAKSNNSLDAFHQKLAMGVFSVTVTTIVVILGLALPTDVFGGGLSGRTGFVTFTLAGPPAIWVIVFLTTARVFGNPRESAGLTPSTLDLRLGIERHHKILGWDYYRNWRAELNSYQRVIEKSELHFIDDLLPKVFYHGRFDLLKPQGVTNTTLFFFSSRGAVKFQRIQATARIENGKRSEIYLGQTSSTPEGRTTCLHFIRNEDRLAQTGRHIHGEWKVAPFKNIDILLVAVYENDQLDDGDYVYVDVSKYVDLELMDNASLDLAIVSDRRIEEYNVWEVAASLVSTEKPVPLMFRKVDSQVNKRGVAAVEKNLDQVAKLFGDWDVVLDQAERGLLGTTIGICPDEVEEFFLKVKGALGGYEVEDANTFQRLFHRPPAADCVITRLRHQQNVILSTFTWC
jgi:hypothetical protein